jgi:hypothetical protein
VIWGRDHSTQTKRSLNAFTAETVVPIRRKNSVTGRVESVNKDELFIDEPGLAQRAFRIGAYTAGYTRDIASICHIQTGLGANFSAYTLPDTIKPYYGAHPIGGNVYLRFPLLPSYK